MALIFFPSNCLFSPQIVFINDLHFFLEKIILDCRITATITKKIVNQHNQKKLCRHNITKRFTYGVASHQHCIDDFNKIWWSAIFAFVNFHENLFVFFCSFMQLIDTCSVRFCFNASKLCSQSWQPFVYQKFCLQFFNLTTFYLHRKNYVLSVSVSAATHLCYIQASIRVCQMCL